MFFAELKELNPELVFQHVPENPTGESLDLQTILLYQQAQYRDLHRAYLYLERKVLPELRRSLDVLTPEFLLSVFLQFHSFATRTLAEDIRAHTPNVSTFSEGAILAMPLDGEIINRTIPSLNVSEDVIDLVRAVFITGWQDEAKIKGFIRAKVSASPEKFLEKGNVTVDDIFALVMLLIRCSTNDSITISKAEEDYINSFTALDFLANLSSLGLREPKQLKLAEARLFACYRENALNANEKALVDRFMRIWCDPENKHSAMLELFANIIPRWKACDRGNKQKVAELIADLYSGIIDIHPTFNGNGRTAVGLLQLPAVLLGYQSFLFRTAADYNDPNSSYNRLRAAIPEDTSVLIEHLMARLTTTPRVVSEYGKLCQELVVLRQTIFDLAMKLERCFPLRDENTYFKMFLQLFIAQLEAEGTSLDTVLIAPNLEIMQIACRVAQQVLRVAQERFEQRRATQCQTFITKKYNAFEIAGIKEQLERITGLTEWQDYCKNSPTQALFLIVRCDDIEKRRLIVKELQAIGLMDVSVKVNNREQPPVKYIKVINIATDSLAAIPEIFPKQAAEKSRKKCLGSGGPTRTRT